MNTENLEKWTAALRSGKYKQGHSYLRVVYGDRTQHCCLGVACEVAGIPIRDGQTHPGTALYDWLGVTPTRESEGTVTHLVDMNDGAELTFEEIADWLDTHRHVWTAGPYVEIEA